MKSLKLSMAYLLALTTVFTLLLSACAGAAPLAVQQTPSDMTNATSQGPASQTTTSKSPDATGKQPAGDPIITLERSGGLAGKTVTWKVYPDGQMQQLPDAKVITLTPAQLTALMADITNAGFFTMDGSYGQFSKCNDCYTYTLTVNQGGQTKTVTAVAESGKAPDQLMNLFGKIQTLAGEQK